MAQSIITAGIAIVSQALHSLEGWVFTREDSADGASSSWHLNISFVAEATILYVTVFVLALLLWVANRNAHFRNTRGSMFKHKPLMGEDIRVNDPVKKRKSHLAMLQYQTELDDDDDDELTAEEDNDLTKRRRERKPPQSEAQQSLLDVVKNIKLFSFLSTEALTECLEHVEYIDLAQGEYLFERNKYDGSLYTVVFGEVRNQFHNYSLPEDYPCDDDDMEEGKVSERFLSFVFGPRDVVTPFLGMLSGLVEEGNKRDGASNPLPFASGVSAVATAPKTRVIRVPPSCFYAVLNKFPADVHRMAQTILGRVQRVTVLTLIRTLGLRKEIIKARNETISSSTDKIMLSMMEWKRLRSTLAERDMTKKRNIDSVKRDAVIVTALQLGIPIKDGKESVNLIAQHSHVISLSEGDTLIETGDFKDSAYVLLQGSLEVGISVPIRGSTTSSIFHSYEIIQPGNLFGTLGCFTGESSLFAIRCNKTSETKKRQGCTLLEIPKRIFDDIVLRHPRVMTRCLDSIISMIPPMVHLLHWNSQWNQLKASDMIVERGDPPDSMFVVLNGRLRANYQDDSTRLNIHGQDSDRQFYEYGRGKSVGDVECLTGSPWSCDVYAIRNSDIVVIPMRLLVVIIQAFPSAGLHFAKAIASKVQHQNGARNLTKSTSSSIMPSFGLKLATVAVIGLNEDVALSEFCTTLVSSLGEIAPTKLMTKKMAREELGERIYKNRNAMHNLKMNQLLADLEEHSRLVVYHADLKYTWWTRLCIKQADYILLVTNADKAPEQSRVEQCLAWAFESMDVRIELVVVGKGERHYHEVGFEDDYENDDKVNVSDQLNNWSEKRRWIAGHHLVRLPYSHHELDFRRMCRRITGRSVGLVLGGGGARGLAHLGVIKALVEAGVTVDLVGGTSQGAFVGAIYANYPDDLETMYTVSRVMADKMGSMKEKLFDITLPMTSFFNGRRFNMTIRKCLGKGRIQDLVLNYFCVSVDIQKRALRVHTKGVLWKYVRASMSLTGYLPPVSVDGSLLVDGGYLNVCPSDVMRHQMGAKWVISVDVSKEFERDYFDYGMSLSGWWVLWNSWNPFVRTVKVPSMGDISDLLVWVSSDQNKKTRVMQASSNLHLTPPVQDFGTLEFEKFDEIVEIGYNYAKPLVDEYVKENPWLVSSRPESHK